MSNQEKKVNKAGVWPPKSDLTIPNIANDQRVAKKTQHYQQSMSCQKDQHCQ